MPTRDPMVFTAPNLAYLMDSPIEFGEGTISGFTVPSIDGGAPSTIRVALHHLGQPADRDDYLSGVERIVLEEQAMMGELPAFEPGPLHLLADYLPWASGDGMEHRNSTVITSSGAIGVGDAAVARTRSPTSSSTRGTSNGSARPRWSPSISRTSTCPANCGWPRDSPATPSRW